jgi:hypothetical protein
LQRAASLQRLASGPASASARSPKTTNRDIQAPPRSSAPSQRTAPGSFAKAVKSNGNGANGNSHGANGNGHKLTSSAVRPKPEPKILFQKFFKSVGPRTYAAQVKELANGNHLLVLTEGKRDPKTQEVRKTRVFVFGEDFTALFRLLHETATFIRANPIPEEIRQRRASFWAKKNRTTGSQAPEPDSDDDE